MKKWKLWPKNVITQTFQILYNFIFTPDEPIDVPTIQDNNDDFNANFDDRTYANFPENANRYADQSFSMDNEEPPLASSSRVQDNR